MNKDEMAEEITACVDDCSDEQVIRIAAGDHGVAIFPQRGLVLHDGNFVDGLWTDSAVQQYWRQQYGRGALVKLYGNTGIDFVELISRPADDDEADTQLDLKLRDPRWVRDEAAKLRAAMYAEITSTAEAALDVWNMVLDDAAQEAFE